MYRRKRNQQPVSRKRQGLMVLKEKYRDDNDSPVGETRRQEDKKTFMACSEASVRSYTVHLESIHVRKR